MDRTTTVPKATVTLPDAAIKEIEKIITKGSDAKVSTGKKGVTVYEEKVKKAYPQS